MSKIFEPIDRLLHSILHLISIGLWLVGLAFFVICGTILVFPIINVFAYNNFLPVLSITPFFVFPWIVFTLLGILRFGFWVMTVLTTREDAGFAS